MTSSESKIPPGCPDECAPRVSELRLNLISGGRALSGYGVHHVYRGVMESQSTFPNPVRSNEIKLGVGQNQAVHGGALLRGIKLLLTGDLKAGRYRDVIGRG